MNLAELLMLKFPDADFLSDILLSDHGDGPVISKWNLKDVPAPTDADIAQWRIDCDLLYRQIKAREKRVYPSLKEQLDMQFHDMKNNTTVWEDTIEAIKLANPIPVE